MSTKHVSKRLLRISGELEGKNPSQITTIALKNEAHLHLRDYAEKHHLKQIEFISRLLLGLSLLSKDDVSLLLLMGQAKEAEIGIAISSPVSAKYLMTIGDLILVPLSYYRRMSVLKADSEKG